MFRLYAKLKAVKGILKHKNIEVFGGLGQKVGQARNNLALAQSVFLTSGGSADCQQRERECLHQFISISSTEKIFLK
jgi:hypothetical protein